jgi:hypothetical protein
MPEAKQLDLILHARQVFERGERLRQRRAKIARLAELRRASRGLPC